MLWIEDNAFHIVLIYGIDGEKVISEAFAKMYSNELHGAKKYVIHVVSPIGNIFYLESLRDLIRNNISYTIIIRYHGDSPQDLEKLVKELDGNALYIIGRDMVEYGSILEKHGIRPVIVEEVMDNERI